MQQKETDLGRPRSRRGRIGASGLSAILLVGLALQFVPAVQAVDTVNCQLSDENGSAMSGEDILITNEDTADFIAVTTDGSGLCSTSTSGINVTAGSTVSTTWVGSGTILGCSVVMPMKTTTIWQGSGNTIGTVGFATLPNPSPIPSTLSLGSQHADRTSGDVTTWKNGLGFHRVQGNGAPWGTFDVTGNYRLTDNWNAGVFENIRDFKFFLQVDYVGYYDSGCSFHSSTGNLGSVQNGGWSTAYLNANLPYDSTSSEPTMSPLSLTSLSANAAGNGASDLMMEIQVTVTIYERDGTTNPGDLQFSATNTYFVEP